MRHGRKINHLGKTATHRDAMLSNMAVSLILYKRITTTVSKAKALRKYVEPLLTKAKEDTTHSRRMVFSELQSKEAVTVLFRDVALKIAERPGGYTRILRTGARLGDNADMCFIELVDYNETILNEKLDKKTKSRRKRSSKKSDTEVVAPKSGKQPKAEIIHEEVEEPVEEQISEITPSGETIPENEEVIADAEIIEEEPKEEEIKEDEVKPEDGEEENKG